MIDPVLHQDPFSPLLISPLSVPLAVSDEQRIYIKEVLDICSSDSKFSEKAYAAINKILTGGFVIVPVASSLSPNTAVIGDPDVVLSVHGTGFNSLSKIVFNGGEEVTVYVSATELKTTIDMSTVSGPVTVPVAVLSSDGILSNSLDFTFAEGTFAASVKSDSIVHKSVAHKSDVKEPSTHKESIILKEPTPKESFTSGKK